MPVKTNKKQLREKFLKIKEKIKSKGKKSEIIQTKLLYILKNSNIKKIIIYCNTQYEPGTNEMLEKLLHAGYELYLPITNINDVARIKKLDDLHPGPFGFLEPKKPAPAPEIYDMIVLPGLFFDLEGYRLGHGNGWYDKFLDKNIFKQKIGLCFDEFLIPLLPRDKWDQKVDIVITDKQLITV